jgi:ferredoxin
LPKWRIEHHKDLCIGCGACAAIEPKHWVMEGDKSHLISSEKSEGNPDGVWEVKEVKDLELNQEAADACPVPCIFVKKAKE